MVGIWSSARERGESENESFVFTRIALSKIDGLIPATHRGELQLWSPAGVRTVPEIKLIVNQTRRAKSLRRLDLFSAVEEMLCL